MVATEKDLEQSFVLSMLKRLLMATVIVIGQSNTDYEVQTWHKTHQKLVIEPLSTT